MVDISGNISIKSNRRKVSNRLAGQDPVPGKVKTLELGFTIDGEVHEQSYTEGELISIPGEATEGAHEDDKE
jgi:hypothetical protein